MTEQNVITAYKVFEVGLDGSMKSAVIGGLLRTVYRPGEWNEAEFQGFFCFDSADNAYSFMRAYGYLPSAGFSLWEVQVQDRCDDALMGPAMTIGYLGTLYRIREFLKRHGGKYQHNSPHGTVVYRRVKPVRALDGGYQKWMEGEGWDQ